MVWLKFCAAKIFDKNFKTRTFFIKKGTKYACWSDLLKFGGGSDLENLTQTS